jgi:hypothetical protein
MQGDRGGRRWIAFTDSATWKARINMTQAWFDGVGSVLLLSILLPLPSQGSQAHSTMAIGQLGKPSVVYDADTAGLEPGLLGQTYCGAVLALLYCNLRVVMWWPYARCPGRPTEPQWAIGIRLGDSFIGHKLQKTKAARQWEKKAAKPGWIWRFTAPSRLLNPCPSSAQGKIKYLEASDIIRIPNSSGLSISDASLFGLVSCSCP